MALKSVTIPCPGVNAPEIAVAVVAVAAAGAGEAAAGGGEEAAVGCLAASDAGTSSRVTRDPSVRSAAQRRRRGGWDAAPAPAPAPAVEPPPAAAMEAAGLYRESTGMVLGMPC